MRPRCGWSPTSPQHAAGIRVEPPPSLPWATGTRPAATAAPDPPLEPPGVRAGSHGLRVVRCRGSLTGRIPYSGRFVVPTMTKPASLRRRTTLWSSEAMKSRIRSHACVSRQPRIARLFLIAIGTPANGRGSSVPTPAACSIARSPSMSMKAPSCGSSASMRRTLVSTSSRALRSPRRTRPASSPAGRNMRSASGMRGVDPNLSGMSNDVQSGLEGVVAFATEIAEPDKEVGALRYRGIDIEELVVQVPFEKVWGLLVDGQFDPGLPPAEPWPLTVRSGDPRADIQSALAVLAPAWGFEPLIDISDEVARDQLARASVMALSFVAQSARGVGRPPVPQSIVDQATSIPERFLIRWRGEADPNHVKAIDAYWISAAEHGMNASTFTARVCASTGADVAAALSGAVGALSGPLHGGAPSRVLQMLDEVAARGDAEAYVKELLDRGDRLMGVGHRVYRAEAPRARVLRRTAKEIGAPRVEAAEALEEAALAELAERKPDRVLATNVEFWSAVVLDFADVPPELFTPLFSCARVAGWSAHIMEQKREGRLIRPSARYVGPPPRDPGSVDGGSA